ncbi:MAG: UbiA family prenyltransferase, partial [Fimbriimonas ginsengisoli]|nr:UbiA family prenyltransferase [Fimbriimonas ginsengisoli]
MGQAKGLGAVRVYLEMIKFEHSVFALPFAMIGMMWGAGGWPGWRVFGWIVLAMVSCRSAAMAFNRIADRRIDAANPRTAARALPVGALGLGQTYLFLGVSVALFLASAAMLNPLALALSPVALLVILGYSTTKRFTSLSHFVLGLSLGIAPAAAWIGATGRLDAAILPLVGAVMLWTGGFDILYSLQDDDFDREQGLRSLPVWLGRPKALVVSRLCHAGSVGLLVWGGSLVGAGPI